MNVLIVGLPRSGTTLLANLMTNVEEKRWVMTEPLFNHKSCSLKPRLLEQTKLFPDFYFPETDLKRGQGFFDEYFNLWGAKEVIPARYEMLYKELNPDKVLVISRNLEDTLKSSYRFSIKRGARIMTLNKRSNGIQAFINFVQNIAPEKKYIIQYEDLLSEDFRETLGEAINWKMNGNPNFGLDRYNRGDEKRDGIKKRKVDNIEYPQVIYDILENNKNYQEIFRYEN